MAATPPPPPPYLLYPIHGEYPVPPSPDATLSISPSVSAAARSAASVAAATRAAPQASTLASYAISTLYNAFTSTNDPGHRARIVNEAREHYAHHYQYFYEKLFSECVGRYYTYYLSYYAQQEALTAESKTSSSCPSLPSGGLCVIRHHPGLAMLLALLCLAILVVVVVLAQRAPHDGSADMHKRGRRWLVWWPTKNLWDGIDDNDASPLLEALFEDALCWKKEKEPDSDLSDITTLV